MKLIIFEVLETLVTICWYLDYEARLIELITKSQLCVNSRKLADYLIGNGVILPPCKVSDTVYVISRYYTGDWEVYKCEIEAITIYEKNTFISCVANDVRFGRINFGLNISEIGHTVFLSEKVAENKLKEFYT